MFLVIRLSGVVLAVGLFRALEATDKLSVTSNGRLTKKELDAPLHTSYEGASHM